MMLMPPKPGTCPICLTDHAAEMPHDLRSLYYHAAWFDAEGSFTLKEYLLAGKPQIVVRASITNTHLPTLRQFMEQFGGYIKPVGNIKGKAMHLWLLHGFADLVRFCETIGPALREKQQEAAVVRMLCEHRISERRKRIGQTDRMYVSWFAHVRSCRSTYEHDQYERLCRKVST